DRAGHSDAGASADPPPAADIRRACQRGRGVSTAVATASPTRAADPRYAGWAGIALGVVAWFIALPPALVRTPAPSIVIGLLAMVAGGWAVRGGERKLGWGAVVAG